jgi:hypothetical protein
LLLLLEPLVELPGGEDAQHRLHSVVAESTDLRAENGVVTGPRGREVKMLRLARDGVLLHAHLGDRETMDDIDGAEGEVDFAAGGENELRPDDIVAAVGVRRVEPDGIAFGGGD